MEIKKAPENRSPGPDLAEIVLFGGNPEILAGKVFVSTFRVFWNPLGAVSFRVHPV
jgi:hypothetical protein